jgi:hypothetical protein
MRASALGALVALGIATSACSDSDIDPKDFPLDVCGSDLFDGLSLAQPADGIELHGSAGLLALTGTLCGGASDRAACEQRARDEAPKNGFAIPGEAGGPADTEYLVYTRGDDVRFATDTAGLVDLVGVIDAPQDARLVAVMYAYYPACRLRQNGDGYDFYAQQSGRCGTRFAIEGHVTADAHLSEKDREQTDPGTEACQ